MKFSVIFFIVVVVCAVGPVSTAASLLGDLLGGLLDVTPEEAAELNTRLISAPISNPSVFPKYNPLQDAKCFNEAYNVPEMTSTIRQSLYADYVKIFRWGLLNPSESPIEAKSTDVTSNRFAGMCLRMAFHDNTINPDASPLSAQEYVASNIQDGWWTGPSVMETSGGDASLLLCPIERLHPNNDYDQTASRVLYSFQTSDSFPHGPGIVNSNGSRSGLIDKYGMSYSDALQNCALAAITFLTEEHSSASEFPSQTEFVQSDAVNQMTFGRLDACHITNGPEWLSSPVGFNNRVALCGNSGVLPGVNFDALQVNEWFVSRGMAVGAWASLFGTHTTLANFQMVKMLRNFGVKDEDYFKDYVGCPFLRLEAPVLDPEDEDSSSCDWQPVCASSAGKNDWPMVRSDCATGVFYQSVDALEIGLQEQISDVFHQQDKYVRDVGSWIPDCVCGMTHLGGPDGQDCVGPNAVNSSPSNSLFGSMFTQNPHPEPGKPIRYVPGSGQVRVVGHNALALSVASDGTLVLTDTHKAIWKSQLGEGWKKLPGEALDVAVVGDGKYYHLYPNNEIYQGTSWNRIGHDTERVVASWDGTLATVSKSSGAIWFKTGYNEFTNWDTLPGVTGARDVSLVGGGTMYYIASNCDVFRTTAYNNPGVRVGGNAAKISASRDGTVVVISVDGSIWQKSGNDNVESWFLIQEGATAEDIAVMDRTTIFISSRASATQTLTYRLFLEAPPATTPATPTASGSAISVTKTQVGHNALTISTGSDGTLVTATNNKEIWKSQLGEGWRKLPGEALDVAVVGDGKYYHLYLNNEIYQGTSWNYIGHDTERVAASWDGTLATVSKSSGAIWFKTGYNKFSNWGTLPGVTGARDVALVGGGTMYYIASNGDVYRTTAYSQQGVKVGRRSVKLSAARDGTVVVVAEDGNLWRKLRNDNTEAWEHLLGETAVEVAVVDQATIFITDTGGGIHQILF